jgi:endonuclease/exonuclease/phosphatase family metal-dependent hydrolase
MKLISLNTWGCRTQEKIYDFIKSSADATDIFCFQELTRNGIGLTEKGDPKDCYEQISNILTEYDSHFTNYGDSGYYEKKAHEIDFESGIGIFVKKGYKHTFIEGKSLHKPNRKWNDYEGRFAAGAVLGVEVDDYFVINVHGLWQGSIKNDTEAKLEQSEDIIQLANKSKKHSIICGDFNLLPDTKAIQMFRDKYQDLIHEYNIQDTRGTLYPKDLRYADFAFVSKDISVKSFAVPDLPISDHLPLIIEFER